jgi:hypothetical protein
MGDILGLGPRPRLVDIHQDEFLRDPLQDQREARRRADHPGPDDCDFHVRLHAAQRQSKWTTASRPKALRPLVPRHGRA